MNCLKGIDSPRCDGIPPTLRAGGPNARPDVADVVCKHIHGHKGETPGERFRKIEILVKYYFCNFFGGLVIGFEAHAVKYAFDSIFKLYNTCILLHRCNLKILAQF